MRSATHCKSGSTITPQHVKNELVGTERNARRKVREAALAYQLEKKYSKARILGESGGLVKVVSEKKYDEVLGMHIVGPRATELIVEACAALELEATTESIAKTMHAHPTLSEAMMEAAEDALGHSIHQ